MPAAAVVVASPVVAAVRAVAAARPDTVAVAGDDLELTYGELWRRAEHRAAELGEGPGVVPVPARHEPDVVVQLLATWLAGGVYCPVDPAYPPAHADQLLGSLAGHDLGDAAYVLFTSGSTGQPKPVAVPHAALAAVVPALRDLFEISDADRVLQFASLSWDTSLEELLPTLTAGGTVVFGADAHSGCLPRLLRFVSSRGVTVLDLPTAVWHELVLHLEESGTGLPDCVRLVVIGGEAVDPERLAAHHRLPGSSRLRLLNTYGATETAMITHAADLVDDRAPIGRPLPHVKQRIDDGELLVGGPALALGYVGRPDATRERFVELDGLRWYRTGDLVTAADDGLLHHGGRLDSVVKVRGIRVDPGEVEAHLRRHHDVAAAAVVGVSLRGRTLLTAYVVPRRPEVTGGSLVAEVRELLRSESPAHLRPHRITAVPELVLTRTGKLDRRATHLRYHQDRPQEDSR